MPLIQTQGLLIVGAIFWLGHGGGLGLEPIPLAVILSFMIALRHLLLEVVSRANRNISAIYQAFPPIRYVWGFYSLAAEYLEPAGGVDKRPFLEGQVTLESVRSCYKNRDDAIKGVTIHIAKGQKVGLVGPSGSGKTTLAHLLLKLYEPYEGSIKIDQVPLSDLSNECVRQGIGIVSQDMQFFDLSVRETIALARPEASEQEVMQAAKKANAHRFIVNLPEGYDTIIGERGVKLSGGEKQRLLISQVILKDPEVIVFDEATSALDSASEAEIMRTVDEFSRDKTLIMIAHRLATLKKVDCIYVLEQGCLAESGSWADLMESQGVFKQMVEQQKLGYEEDKAAII